MSHLLKISNDKRIGQIFLKHDSNMDPINFYAFLIVLFFIFEVKNHIESMFFKKMTLLFFIMWHFNTHDVFLLIDIHSGNNIGLMVSTFVKHMYNIAKICIVNISYCTF